MTEDQESLNKVFRALSDQTRRSILQQLKQKSFTVMELADHYEMTFQAVSKHLKVLEQARLLIKEKRGRQFICHANSESLADAIHWIGRQHDFWSQNFDSLDDFLKQNQGE